MFKKRQKKDFPPGTFIPTPARIATILQLCIAFSLLLWQASQPFMGDLFRVKSQLLIYQDLMGHISEKSSLDLARLHRNAERFTQLPRDIQTSLKQKYSHLLSQLQYSFAQKMHRLAFIFMHELSPFEIAWIFFSIVLSILLLKRIEGAPQALWLLPCLTFLFLWDNQFHGAPAFKNHDSVFFPTEKEIVNVYLREPLTQEILKQREQLKKGWDLYLIKRWSQEIPSQKTEEFQRQVERGEFFFNTERLLSLPLPSHSLREIESPFLLCIYLGWNLFFAFFINRQLKQEVLTLSPCAQVT